MFPATAQHNLRNRKWLATVCRWFMWAGWPNSGIGGLLQLGLTNPDADASIGGLRQEISNDTRQTVDQIGSPTNTVDLQRQTRILPTYGKGGSECTFARRVPGAPSIQMISLAIYHNALPPNITPSSSPGTLSTGTLYDCWQSK